MPFLVRAFLDLDVWPEDFEGSVADIPGDCITHRGLGTKKNRLSVWRVDSKEELSEAILGIVAQYRTLTGLSVVFLDEDELARRELLFENKPDARARVANVGQRHYDLTQLNYDRIGKLALYILELVRAGHAETVTTKTIMEVLYSARDAQRLDFGKLEPAFRNSIETLRAKYYSPPV